MVNSLSRWQGDPHKNKQTYPNKKRKTFRFHLEATPNANTFLHQQVKYKWIYHATICNQTDNIFEKIKNVDNCKASFLCGWMLNKINKT